MIRKEFHAGVGYSVVELGGVRHVFAAAAPCRGDTLPEQTEEVLQALKNIFEEEGSFGSIVSQSVFLRDIKDQTVCRQIMREFYGNELPATTYVPQPPCEGKLLSIEAWGMGGGRGEVEIERVGDCMVNVRYDGITWAYLADVRPETAERSVYDRTLSAFRSAGERLGCAGFRFDEVLRTWLYLGDITGMEGQSERYRELNRARADFYRNLKFGAGLTPREWSKPVFPASTGIGAEGNSVTISCVALRSSRPGVVLLPLENPQQTSAYDYAHQYGTESPKFARAMAVATGESVATFISGTASITASETRHGMDFQRQTQQTLDNIEALISTDNFHDHGYSGPGVSLNDLVMARVYLKRPEDYNQAQAICRKRLGDLPVLYVVGDICRPELLVEIEGIAFRRT